MRSTLCLTLVLMLPLPALAQPDLSLDSLDGTSPLVMDEPLDVVMVRGINYFAEREIADSPNRRAANWNRDYSSAEAYQQSIEPNRQRLREIIGAVDERVRKPRATSPVPPAGGYGVDPGQLVSHDVRWDVFDGVHAEGILVQPHGAVHASVILVPDPDNKVALYPHGGQSGGRSDSDRHIVTMLANAGCQVLILEMIDRSDVHSGHPEVRYTNQPHREFIYRMAFEMGRHIVGFEVLKVLAAVDWFKHAPTSLGGGAPVMVAGVGEGGLVALHAAAIDQRIDAALVSGYFQEREHVWREPIYRNIWGQLNELGDAEIASLVAPRPLVIEACAVPEVSGPPTPHDGRSGGAAPGRIATAEVESVRREVARAKEYYRTLESDAALSLVESKAGMGDAFSVAAVELLLAGIGRESRVPGRSLSVAQGFDHEEAQRRQVAELNRFTQRLMHSSDKYRDKVWAKVDRTNLETATASLDEYRDWVYDTLIGRLPEPTMPLNPRTRKVIDEPTHVGYEVVLDLFPPGDTERPMPTVPDAGSVRDSASQPLAVDKDFFAVGEDWGVIAGGILLIPRDLKPGEQRPVVVCQHGLEGTPMSAITTDRSDNNWNYYKGFATELCRRGFITYAPQNPYRGGDAFRHIQRKSNPMGRSLFSYIIPQHKRTLEFLASLPYVDPGRIGFYGLSYGGKTAVRVPPLLAKSPERTSPNALDAGPLALDPHYALSICSADFDEWVRKNASSEDKYSYVFYGEYEIFEWNMGHVANYAELSYLMTPRPFMVERGHDDGVAPDEWVAWEYAKVKRHYDKLGIGDRTEMEVFDGPHTINGVGTYDFLHRHLNWPAPGEQ